MPQTPTPDKAAALAFNLKTNLKLALSALSQLDMQADKVYACLQDATNENARPGGYDIEDVPGTPFQVIFHPQSSDSYHAIVCRGVDVSDHINSAVEEAALNVVKEVWADANDKNRLKDAADLRRLDEMRGK
jgi:hypothetical protein